MRCTNDGVLADVEAVIDTEEHGDLAGRVNRRTIFPDRIPQFLEIAKYLIFPDNWHSGRPINTSRDNPLYHATAI